MERGEAEAIYDAGRDVVVEVLLRMDRQIGQLTGRVERLEREVRKDSRNSSLPPSSDPPSEGSTGREKGRSPRQQGAQPGHEGKGRELLPAWAVDQVVEHWPERCGCGHAFCKREWVAVREPARHQVEELPRIATIVTEHRCQRVRCPDCGCEQMGEMPWEVAASAFGPRLQAAIVALAVRNRVSRRDTVELCRELFGARISVGSVDQILTRAAVALKLPHENLVCALQRARRVNMDETGWRLKGQRRALWGAFTDKLAVYRICADRHEDNARELLGKSSAIVTSDRRWAYNHLPLARRQICWSHLQRDFTAHAECGGAERELGEIGLSVCAQVFWAWEIYQHTGERKELNRRVRQLRRELKPILRQYSGKSRATSAHAGWRATCSKCGPRCGPSPTAKASIQPTTTLSAHSAALSSTASSP